MNVKELNRELGNIDLYLLDLILKGLFDEQDTILDAGCGEGRNLVYFLRNGFQVYGIDSYDAALRMLRFQLNSLSPGYPADRFTHGDIKNLPYPDGSFSKVLCIAVLHFANSEKEFRVMFDELVRVLRPGGQLYIRMTDNTTMDQAHALDGGKYLLPDGSTRFLLTHSMLESLMKTHNLTFAEAHKSVVVQGMRSMNVLLLSKTE